MEMKIKDTYLLPTICKICSQSKFIKTPKITEFPYDSFQKDVQFMATNKVCEFCMQNLNDFQLCYACFIHKKFVPSKCSIGTVIMSQNECEFVGVFDSAQYSEVNSQAFHDSTRLSFEKTHSALFTDNKKVVLCFNELENQKKYKTSKDTLKNKNLREYLLFTCLMNQGIAQKSQHLNLLLDHFTGCLADLIVYSNVFPITVYIVVEKIYST